MGHLPKRVGHERAPTGQKISKCSFSLIRVNIELFFDFRHFWDFLTENLARLSRGEEVGEGPNVRDYDVIRGGTIDPFV